MQDRWAMRPIVPVLALALSCSRVVVGLITPEHFQFAEVVPLPNDGEPGGWQAVCIQATLRNGNTGQDLICSFEVGVPMRNGQQGAITRQFAQTASAVAANNAAHLLLSQLEAGEMLGMICQRFRPLMQTQLRALIFGAQVQNCHTEGVPTVRFDSSPLH